MILSDKERVTLAVNFVTGYMQSGRSFPSFRDLAILGLDFVEKMEDEVMRRGSYTTNAEVVSIPKRVSSRTK